MGEQVASDTALIAILEQLADNKYFLGRRYAEWCTAAPTLESAVAAAAMAQDEIGHARSFYPVLQDVAGKSSETEPETRTHFTNVEFLSRPFEGWCDFVAANFLLDTAFSVLLEAARESSFGPLAQRARRILEEEPLHWLHGEGWMRRLSARGGGVQRALQQSCSVAGGQALEWFSVADEDAVSRNILNQGPQVLRGRFRDRVGPVMEECGLQL